MTQNMPAITPTENYYIVNRETQKLELHFTKATYAALTDAQKKAVKSNFLWGRNSSCWISRAKEPNLYHAIRCAESVGLVDAGKTGERLSFAEQQARKAERAERRADRFDARSEAAERTGDQLQKPIRDMHGDIAFFTQPNINSSAGRAFTRRRDRMFESFDRGFEAYRKSAYYAERAEIARRTANFESLKDRAFIVRRINEREATIRKIRKNVEHYEDILNRIDAGKTVKDYCSGNPYTAETVQKWIEDALDRLEQELDALGYYQEALDALGGVRFSRENVKPGFTVEVQRYGAAKVMGTGPKNFTAAFASGMALSMAYAEIIRIISDAVEPNKAHPFKVGESFKLRDGSTHTITKTTAKTVTIQSEAGATYRVTPKYRPINSAKGWQWVLMVGSGSWASDLIYRD